MAAQELEFTSIGDRGHSNATSSMKEMRAMGRSSAMGVCGHRGKVEPRFKPTRRFLRSNEAPIGKQLIPGIPNEIIYDLIVPKLSWKDLPVLSSVSRAWEEAILTNRVYEGRVRANSTETLIIHTHVHDDRLAFALYSAREKRCYKLPELPCLPRVLNSCECIALDGKIYVLGGYEVRAGLWEESCAPEARRVYVLNLGEARWKQCASMLERRCHCACGVIDDKIYVFGGTKVLQDLPRSEVYDTQKNTWSPIMSPIMPMTKSTFRYVDPLVAPIAKELFLYHDHVRTLAVYNPAKDEWRFVECSGWEGKAVFAAEGKFYSISRSELHVYDVEQKSWINRHTHSFAPHRPEYSAEFRPLSISAVKENELYIRDWFRRPPGPHSALRI